MYRRIQWILFAAISVACISDCASQKSMARASIINPATGRPYKTVTIGKQTWMAENLNCKIGSSFERDNSGILYDWETAKNICPVGWHLPNIKEWQQLVDTIGTNAGSKLKSSSGWGYYKILHIGGYDPGCSNWINIGNGMDLYGFDARPTGYTAPNRTAYCTTVGETRYWSASEASPSYLLFIKFKTAWFFGLSYRYKQPIIDKDNRVANFCVRCVKDSLYQPLKDSSNVTN
jgi:uncharacterized protein (TIGR02145 family)